MEALTFSLFNARYGPIFHLHPTISHYHFVSQTTATPSCNQSTRETMSSQRKSSSLPLLTSSYEKDLARSALRHSDILLRDIAEAREHLLQTYRVQIDSHDYPSAMIPEATPAAADHLAMDFLLGRLITLETGIKVNQFFPRSYFTSGFTETETSETVLRDFTRKYRFNDDPPSWGTSTYTEVQNYLKYDAPDIRNYLHKRLATIDQSIRPSIKSDKSFEVSPNPSTVFAGVTVPTGPFATVASSPATSCHSVPAVPKSPSIDSCKSVRFNFKNVFSMGKGKKNREGSSLARSDSRAARICNRTKALLTKHSSMVPPRS